MKKIQDDICRKEMMCAQLQHTQTFESSRRGACI